ncbi:MAG: hypothetical protein BACD_03422 [Bacteroides rodentium]|jgi:hypothetical protein
MQLLLLTPLTNAQNISMKSFYSLKNTIYFLCAYYNYIVFISKNKSSFTLKIILHFGVISIDQFYIVNP